MGRVWGNTDTRTYPEPAMGGVFKTHTSPFALQI